MKLAAVSSPVRKALRLQFHTLLYRARQRTGLRVFALAQRLRRFVDHVTTTAGAANGQRVRHWCQVRSGSRGDTGVMIHIQSLIDDAKCFETVRTLRWPDGVSCPHCDSFAITKQGRDDTQPERQCYLCQSCEQRFGDLTDTIFAGHHQPLRVWILCLYFMGLNLSNHQIGSCTCPVRIMTPDRARAARIGSTSRS